MTIITSYQSHGRNFIWHWRPDQINIVRDRVWCAEANELIDKDEAMTITIFMQTQLQAWLGFSVFWGVPKESHGNG